MYAMSNKYGGVNNKKSIDEIREAVVVSAPIFRKKQPKSKAGVVGGWLVYWAVSWVLTVLIIVATGLSERMIQASMPLVLQFFVIPSIPFLLTLIWSVFKSKKAKKQKDSGD